MKRFLFLLLPLILLVQATHSQSKNPGIIYGSIIDSKSKVPVEYANIVVYDTTKKMVTGVVSDSSGHFRIKDVPWGFYYIEYSFIGYNKQKSELFTLSKKSPQKEFRQLHLIPVVQTMEEVNITAEKSMMVTKIDRKVFNVDKDILAQTGTAMDMLRNIPSLAVDMDGNISLRGSENVTVLINGRPSLMAGIANLDQMPASLIEKIEVITNPSAKYRPDGTGGIINIILKKEQKAGFNTSLGANVGNHDRFNTNVQLNLNSGPFNVYGSYGFRQDYRIRSGESYSQNIDTANSTSTYLTQSSNGTAKMRSNLAQLGADWTFTKKDILGLSGTLNIRNTNRNDLTTNLYQDMQFDTTEQFERQMNGSESEQGYGLKGFYEHNFTKDKEHQFRFDFDYQYDKEKEDDYWTNTYTYPTYPLSRDHSLATNAQREINTVINYNRPMGELFALEAGYEGTTSLLDQIQDVYHQDNDTSSWIYDPSSSTQFKGGQSILALYGLVNFTWKSFGAMFGLRAEEALLDLNYNQSDSSTTTSYFALYPTLHLDLKMGRNEWQMNYSRRVNRPDVEDLNPFPEYRDPRNIFQGNPNLKPEDIHSIELGYSFQNKGLTLIPTLFYRYKVNGITRVTTPVNDTVYLTTMENLSKDQSSGIDFSGIFQWPKVASFNFSASAFYNEIDASNIGYSDQQGAFSWNAKVNASFYITKTTLFQVNGQYRSKALTAQGYRMPTWVVNMGFRQDFWKKRFSLIATISDLFDSQKWQMKINTPVLVQESTRRRDARAFYIGFVYNFSTNGTKKSKDPKFEFENGGE